MPFIKGQSGNPKGAPEKTLELSTWIRKELVRKVAPNTIEGYETELEAVKILASRIVNETLTAKEFDDLMSGAHFIADRTEGKPQQNIDHTTGGRPFGNLPDEELDRIIGGK